MACAAGRRKPPACIQNPAAAIWSNVTLPANAATAKTKDSAHRPVVTGGALTRLCGRSFANCLPGSESAAPGQRTPLRRQRTPSVAPMILRRAKRALGYGRRSSPANGRPRGPDLVAAAALQRTASGDRRPRSGPFQLGQPLVHQLRQPCWRTLRSLPLLRHSRGQGTRHQRPHGVGGPGGTGTPAVGLGAAVPGGIVGPGAVGGPGDTALGMAGGCWPLKPGQRIGAPR